MEANKVVFRPETSAALAKPARPAGPYFKKVIPKLAVYLQEHPGRVFHIAEVALGVGIPERAVGGSLYRMARNPQLPVEKVGWGLYRWNEKEPYEQPPLPDVEEVEAIEVADGFELVAWLPDGRPLLMGTDGYTYGTEQVVVRRVRRIGPA